MRYIKILKAADCKTQKTEWGALIWFTSRELRNSETMTIGQCFIKPGCSNPCHSHPNCEEVLHVIQGRIVHSIEEGKEVAMEKGDTICIPPNIVHNARNIGKMDAVLMICFSSADRQTKGE